MAENLFVSYHKSSNKKSREGWDRTFGKNRQVAIYCTVEEHQRLHAAGLAMCSKCGQSTDTRIVPVPKEDR